MPANRSDQNRPLVSIIMPTHNAGAYIGQAIESVLAQTYPHWELIIVDDASTDETAEIVKRYAEDARIRYQRVERIGHPAGVRNNALRLANGELIAFLDSDDLYFPETLEKLSAPLLKDTALSAVYGFAFSMDEQERPLPQALALAMVSDEGGEISHGLPSGYSHCWENIVTSKISCMLPGLMLRRSAWERIGFFNEDLCGPEDYEFYVRMFLNDYDGVLCLPEYVYRYRIHAASLTKTPAHYQKLLDSCLRIMSWMFEEAPIPATVRHLKSQAYVACYRYLARERLLHGQPDITRQIVARAFQDQNISLFDNLRACLPLLIRSVLPTGLDQRLVELKRLLRAFLKRHPEESGHTIHHLQAVGNS